MIVTAAVLQKSPTILMTTSNLWYFAQLVVTKRLTARALKKRLPYGTIHTAMLFIRMRWILFWIIRANYHRITRCNHSLGFCLIINETQIPVIWFLHLFASKWWLRVNLEGVSASFHNQGTKPEPPSFNLSRVAPGKLELFSLIMPQSFFPAILAAPINPDYLKIENQQVFSDSPQ